jgi:ZIP family zinc transporter
VSSAEIVALGAVAGATIFLGLPVGRVRCPQVVQAVLNAGAAGVLVFLLVETVQHGFEPVEEAVEDRAWLEFAGRGPLFLVSFAVGLLGLASYDRWSRRRDPLADDPARLALLIAVGIGVHNFAEGLAIGQSAASGAVDLAVLLVVGFALHNATEGFGIVAPLTGRAALPTWGFLGVLGVIAGLPTFLGTLAGQSFESPWLEIAFLGLASGSILFVVVQLLRVASRLHHDPMHVMWGLFAGLALGLATELVLVAAGL